MRYSKAISPAISVYAKSEVFGFTPGSFPSKEVTRSSGRPAFEAIADITLELGSWVDGNFIVFAESLDDDNVPSDTAVQPEHQPIPTAPTRTVTTTPVTPAPPRSRLSSKHLGAIQAIVRKLGLDHTGLRAVAEQRYGVVPEHLTKAQANGKGHDDQADEMGRSHAAPHHPRRPAHEHLADEDVLRCPRQYQLKYVLGVQPAFVPVAFAFGLSFHGAAAALYGAG